MQLNEIPSVENIRVRARDSEQSIDIQLNLKPKRKIVIGHKDPITTRQRHIKHWLRLSKQYTLTQKRA